MLIQDGSTRLEISILEVVPAGRPDVGDVRLSVALAAGTFRGRNDSVWVTRSEWHRFLADLGNLERRRQGQARLTSMSPANLELCVHATDRAGHMAVEGFVGDYVLGGRGTQEARVPFVLTLDPALLRATLDELDALISSGQ